MRKVTFWVNCIATYCVEDFPVPDDIERSEIWDYLKDHLDEVPYKDLEIVSESEECTEPLGIVDALESFEDGTWEYL